MSTAAPAHFDEDPTLSIGQCAALACVLEATAPKPGNVHRGADFEDMTYLDFITSSLVIAPAMEAAAEGESLGRTVLAAVRATRHAVDANTNLGAILLLAPLAQVPRSAALKTSIQAVLNRTNAEDARLVYEAIRTARPGGLGEVSESDVHGEPPESLLEAMRLAAERDLVARQYAEGFAQVLEVVAPWLAEEVVQNRPLAGAIVTVHLRLMAEFPDSLIARKCGAAVAQEAADRAAHVLQTTDKASEVHERAIADFDFWLRADQRRNPGTTADLITAGLFVALRDGIINLPMRFYQ